MAKITEALENNELILLDGGISTEIQQRGVSMDNEAWSALAAHTHPDLVRAVHEDYIRAGAQVITANTYSTARHVLESIGCGDQTRAINTEAVQAATAARDNTATGPTWIAGSMSSFPPFNSPHDITTGAAATANYQELAEILAEAGVDLIIAEMMRDFENAPMVINAALAVDLPVWIGYSACCPGESARVQSYPWRRAGGETVTHDFEELVKEIVPLGGDAAGIMHSQIEDTGPALEILAQYWPGPKLAYAETGSLVPPDWTFEEACSPDDYVAACENWLTDHAIQIVGGCCGTGPEHIRRLRERLPRQLPL
jgi:S-methylmethionine-dependent homocysteine/selenocysteine methylase